MAICQTPGQTTGYIIDEVSTDIRDFRVNVECEAGHGELVLAPNAP